MHLPIAIALVALVSTALARVVDPFDHEARRLFAKFKVDYGKNYNGYDNEYRFGVFKQNLQRAEQYQREEQGTAQYGVTRFSDLTAAEFNRQFANARFDSNAAPELEQVEADPESIPASFDWRNRSAVGPVEDQGACGSCWAFSVAGNVESQWFLKTHQLLSLSKQQLVDCDSRDHGCHGGYPPQTYSEIYRMGGLEKSTDYPYAGRDQRCHLDRSKVVAKITKAVWVKPDERIQAAWLSVKGPMSIALNADPLQFYKSGIMQPTNCPASGINHAVLTVGYGSEGGVPYWIVKNSWSASWGEQGYFRIYRGRNTCGVNALCTSALVA